MNKNKKTIIEVTVLPDMEYRVKYALSRITGIEKIRVKTDTNTPPTDHFNDEEFTV